MEILHDYPGEGQGFNDSIVISRFCLVATMQCWFVSPCHLFSVCLCKVIKVISPDLSFFGCPFDPFQLHSKLISPVILRFAASLRLIIIASDVQEFHPQTKKMLHIRFSEFSPSFFQ